ncbi:uncharacterized protein [Antedon mediterranea]|uniref:uncharacterized protein n=1 Tax=Antedon mediterranea TaxID=105859 RepID=UPI003AF773A7
MEENTFIDLSFEELEVKHRSFKGHLTRARDRFTRVLDRDEPELVKVAFDHIQKKIRKITDLLDAMDVVKPPDETNTTTRLHAELMSAADDVEKKYQEYRRFSRNEQTAHSSQGEPTAAGKDEEMIKLIKAQSDMVAQLTIKLNGNGSDNKRPSIKTPGLPAPRWDGSPRNFHSWHVRIDQYFESAGIKGDQEKLMVLLNGDALPKSIQDHIADCCSVEGDNGAWARLKEKVPTSAIVRDVILTLQMLKPMKSATAKEMRPVLNGLTDFARRMRELGKELELSSSVVVELASQKIDAELSFEYMRQIKQDEPTIPSLISFLRSEMEARERREQPHMFGDQNASTHHITRQISTLENTTQFPPKSNFKGAETSTDDCPFCTDHSRHLIIKCPNFNSKSNEERRLMIMEARRCFLCFRTNHSAFRCPRHDKKRCSVCQLFHHRLIACPPNRTLRINNADGFCQSQMSPKTQAGANTNLRPIVRHENQVGTNLGQNPFIYLPASTNQTVSNMNLDKTSINSPQIVQAGANPSLRQTVAGPSQNPFVSLPPSTNQTISKMNSTRHAERRRYSPTTYVEIQDNEGNWQKAVAFFDSGADTTLVKCSTAKSLGLNGLPFVFTYGVAGGGIVQENSARYQLRVRPLQELKAYDLVAISVQKPAHDSPSVGEDIFDEHPHLTVVKEHLPAEEAEIDLLIGYDYQSLTTPLKTIRSLTDPDTSPTAAKSALGWTIIGQTIPKPTSNVISHITNITFMDDSQLLYTSDVIGVKPTTLCTCTDKEIAESQFIKHCRKNLQINEKGRITVEMPWKDGFPESLDCNRVQAVTRMISHEARLLKNKQINDYNYEIQALLDNGFTRELTPSEDRNEGWYLQHHAVHQQHKTTKIRIVWNSAAKFNGLCLNDGFHKGPDFLNSLVTCFLYWRKYGIAVAGDVRKMFNQIALSVRDQKFHRFVWRFGDTSKDIRYFQWLRLPFGDKPAPDISMMAVRLLAEANADSDPIGALRIKDRMYMDDITDSFTKPNDAVEAVEQVTRILRKGSFEIKVWHSNHPMVDQCPEEKHTRVLGHLWNKLDDTVTIQLDKFDEEQTPLTKRKVSSLVARLWDPLGMLSPVSIRYKIGLQEIWAARLDWDDVFDDEQTTMWKGFIKEMNPVADLGSDEGGWPRKWQTSDASEAAFGSVIWLRWDTPAGVKLTYVIAKALVAPLKKRSIPRLELTAVVVMARLAKLVLEVVGDVSLCKFWTDSKVVLSWVRSPARTFKPFVSARVQEIQDTLPTFIDDLCYIPSNINPADQLTKPIYPSDLQKWIQGPDFLFQSSNQWPNYEPDYDTELKQMVVKEYTTESLRKTNYVTAVRGRPTFEDLLVNTVSNWTRLVHRIAYCRRFILKRRPETLFLTADELQRAEFSLFYVSQRTANDRLDAWSTRKLNPKVDESGMIRVEGRLNKLHIPEQQKRPILLRREDHFW